MSTFSRNTLDDLIPNNIPPSFFAPPSIRVDDSATMESFVHAPLNALEQHLNRLVTSLSQTNAFTNAPQIAKELVADDDRLTAALHDLQKHQRNWARIDALREEARGLEDLLKDQMRQTVALRQNIVSIHPSIEDEEEDEEDGTVGEIDYQTLLAFAARIGKHNAAAAREAEAEAVRRKIATKVNGSTAGGAEARETEVTAETTAELSRIDDSVGTTRAALGMAFPDANVLRTGALGQLQLLREKHQTSIGDDDDQIFAAVDRDVEALVRQTEDVADEPQMDEAADVDVDDSTYQANTTHHHHPAQTASTAAAPARPPKRKKVDLDFPSSDEEEDE
jgi:hypothetical protein